MKIRIVILIIFSLLHVNIGAMGEVLDIDSVSHSKPPHYLIPAIGGSLVVAGSLLDFDHGGSWEGMPYTPSFSYKADEVLRFAPAVALVGVRESGGAERRRQRDQNRHPARQIFCAMRSTEAPRSLPPAWSGDRSPDRNPSLPP